MHGRFCNKSAAGNLLYPFISTPGSGPPGRRSEAREYWLSRVRGITRNFDWQKLLRGERAAPQGAIYRDTLLVTFADGGLERIRQQSR